MTPTMEENSEKFRLGWKYIAPGIEKFNYFVQRHFFQLREANKVWDVTNVAVLPPTPLEHTSYFNDGLYSEVEATPVPTGFYDYEKQYRISEEDE